jgi:PAS domain-containing protein
MLAPELFLAAGRAASIALIGSSYEQWFGPPLVLASEEPVVALWNAPAAILAHGIEADPLFFFANRVALERFGYAPDVLIGLPSRLTAEPPARDERRRMLDRVARDGFIDDYKGIRITATGERFPIDQAAVWSLIDHGGTCLGQAARFAV